MGCTAGTAQEDDDWEKRSSQTAQCRHAANLVPLFTGIEGTKGTGGQARVCCEPKASMDDNDRQQTRSGAESKSASPVRALVARPSITSSPYSPWRGTRRRTGLHAHRLFTIPALACPTGALRLPGPLPAARPRRPGRGSFSWAPEVSTPDVEYVNGATDCVMCAQRQLVAAPAYASRAHRDAERIILHAGSHTGRDLARGARSRRGRGRHRRGLDTATAKLICSAFERVCPAEASLAESALHRQTAIAVG
jgi:hypothetical protein